MQKECKRSYQQTRLAYSFSGEYKQTNKNSKQVRPKAGKEEENNYHIIE